MNGRGSVTFCWGNTADGQLGLGGIEEEQILTPRLLKFFNEKYLAEIACGRNHSIFVMKDGTLYSCGNNDYGQLGHQKPRKKPGLIDSIETQQVVKAVCGHTHSVAVTDSGQVYSWGSNSNGQLGRGTIDQPHSSQPKLVKFLSMHEVVQIAAGNFHTLALSKDSRLFSWGQNSNGQLGVEKNGFSDTPVQIACLGGLAISQIAAGGHHSFSLSVSGSLFGWGKNSFGQIGVGDEKDRSFPVLCKTLKSQKVSYVTCGEDHSAVLTQEGGVFTFGNGSNGQLGHNTRNHQPLPRKVFELMGSEVNQIACGRRHTLAFAPHSGRIYAFGVGGNGQLGTGSTSEKTSPATVLGPFVPKRDPKASLPAAVKEQQAYVIGLLSAGGDQSFTTANLPSINLSPRDNRLLPKRHQIALMTYDILNDMAKIPADKRVPDEFAETIEKVFSSVACLCGSFLLPHDEHYGCSGKHHGINLDAAKDAFQKIACLPNQGLLNLVYSAIERNLIPSLKETKGSPADHEALRIYLTLPYCKLFDEPERYIAIQCPFARYLLNLTKVPSRIVEVWWATLPNEEFQRLVLLYKRIVIFILSQSKPLTDFEIMSRQMGLQDCLNMLKKLNHVNCSTQSISYAMFYIPELLEKVDVRADYINWIQQGVTGSPNTPVSLCNYPFVFDGQAKTLLLQTDALIQMRIAVEETNRRNLAGLFLAQVDPINPCLVLGINRDNLLQDTLGQLAKHKDMDLKKPLKVTFLGEPGLDGGGLRKVVFLGEEAIDEGGVRKEFFMLLLREIMDPKYGMFQYYEESRYLWFNPESFEESVMFGLIGVLVGLAIYNSTIINLTFPLALYKKMLKKPVTLDDFKILQPSVGRSLQSLLDYEGDDVEDVFGLTFEITREVFGQMRQIELIPHGAKIPVTKENKKEYVDVYVSHMFDLSVQDKFQAFYVGFHRVAGGRVLELFQPLELQAMVVGNENYDWDEFEKNTDYKSGYSARCRPVMFFWSVFQDLSLEDKKKFLLFLTGSDRIPIHGMKAVKMYIQPSGGGDSYLPVAHTCFNLLDLPQYSTKEFLKEKLLQAIQHTEGFALV